MADSTLPSGCGHLHVYLQSAELAGNGQCCKRDRNLGFPGSHGSWVTCWTARIAAARQNAAICATVPSTPGCVTPTTITDYRWIIEEDARSSSTRAAQPTAPGRLSDRSLRHVSDPRHEFPYELHAGGPPAAPGRCRAKAPDDLRSDHRTHVNACATSATACAGLTRRVQR